MFLLFSIFCVYLVVSGFSQYNNFFNDIEGFKEYEKLKASQYLNYEQYGSFGFRIIAKPPALSVFFSGFNFINLESTINTKEIVSVFSPMKGSEFFKTFVSHQDFSGFLYIFGSFLMLYFGFSTFKSPGSFKLRKNFRNVMLTFVFRGLSVNIFFHGVMIVSWMLAVIMGVKFSSTDFWIYVVYSIYLLIFLAFFFILGALISIVKSFQGYAFIVAALIWLLMVIVIPEIHKLAVKRKSFSLDRIENVNTQKLERLFEFEKKAREFVATLREGDNIRKKLREFVNLHYRASYEQNKQLECDLQLSVEKLMGDIDHNAVLCPTIYYSHLSRELSGNGGRGYCDFLDRVLTLKDRFFEFYMTRRYDSDNSKMELFIRAEDQIFPLKSELPGSMVAGFLSLVVYVAIIGTINAIMVWFRMKDVPFQGNPIISVKELQKGKFYFYHCKDPDQREKIIQHALSTAKAHVVRKVAEDDFDRNIPLRCWFRYMCALEGLKVKDLAGYLEVVDLKESDWNADTANVDLETMLLLYLSIKIAKQMDLYVFDDFLKGRSRRFEILFNQLVKMAPTSLYVGSDMFDLVKSHDDRSESIIFSIDPGRRITFR